MEYDFIHMAATAFEVNCASDQYSCNISSVSLQFITFLAFKCTIVFWFFEITLFFNNKNLNKNREYSNVVKSQILGGQLTSSFRLIKKPTNVLRMRYATKSTILLKSNIDSHLYHQEELTKNLLSLCERGLH